MTDPIRELTPDLIRQNPALAVFSNYVREHNGNVAPRPADIKVTNEHPNDGLITLTYINNGNVYVGRISVMEHLLLLRRGRLAGSGAQWAGPPERQRVADPCSTVRTLGGDEENAVQCADAQPPAIDLFSQRTAWYGKLGLAWWTGLEAGGWVIKHRSFTRWMARNISSNLRITGGTAATWNQSWRHLGATGAGLLAMGAADPLADALGWHPQYHNHERWALSVGMGYGAYFGANTLINRFSRTPGLRPTGLGASLLSAALVDATIGKAFENDPLKRRLMHAAGFFLPQVYRSFMGERALAFSERRGVGAISRWGGRAMIAAFVADAGYMAYNRIQNGAEGSLRQNHLYSRAQQIYNRFQNPFAAVAHGAAEMVMPSLAEHWVPEEYVHQAEQELRTEAATGATQVSQILRHSLFFHPYGRTADPDFYRHIDWDWLRGENQLVDIQRPDGKTLPVTMVAEQLGNPGIYARRVAGRSEEEIIAYVQQQFSGFELSTSDVREILGRMALYHARQQITEMHTLDTPSHQPLLGCFDAAGRLIPGKEHQLLGILLPEADQPEEQLLALRHAGLVTQLRTLQVSRNSSDPELLAATQTARNLGLIDAAGNFVEGEVTRHGLALFDRYQSSHPILPTNQPANDAEIIEQIIRGG